MRKLINFIVLWFTSRKKLVNAILDLQDSYEKLYDHIKTSKSLTELHEHLTSKEVQEPRVVSAEFNESGGHIVISHWATAAMVANFWDTFKAGQGKNYLEMSFNPVVYWENGMQVTDRMIVTLQRVQGKTPGELVTELKAEVARLKEKNGEV